MSHTNQTSAVDAQDFISSKQGPVNVRNTAFSDILHEELATFATFSGSGLIARINWLTVDTASQLKPELSTGFTQLQATDNRRTAIEQ